MGQIERKQGSKSTTQGSPRSVGGMGIIDHIDPGGVVPSVTNVTWSGLSLSIEPLGNTIACSSCVSVAKVGGGGVKK